MVVKYTNYNFKLNYKIMGKSLVIHGADFSANKVFMPIIVNNALTLQQQEMVIESAGYSTFLMEAENNDDKWGTMTRQIDNQGDYALNILPYGCTKIRVTCPSNIQMSVGVSKLNSNGKYSTIKFKNWTSEGVIEYDYSQYADDAVYYQINFDSSAVSINDITIEFF